MKTFWSKHKAEIGWLTGLAVIVLMGFWWVPGDRGTTDDTLSINANGKKAFYLATRQLLGDQHTVSRSTESLIPPDDVDTLVMLGPARYPDATEWHELYEWVRSGRTLIFAARYGDPGVTAEEFGFKVISKALDEKKASPFGAKPKKAGKAGASSDDDEIEDPFKERTAETDLLSGTAYWQSEAWIEADDRDTTVLVKQDGRSHAIVREIGYGCIVVTSSDYVFCNLAAMKRSSNRQLAWRLLEKGEPAGPVCFDETLNSNGAPAVFGILFNSRLRPFTLQLLLATIIFGWWDSRRFGPIEKHEDATRRNIREHAMALGQMHYQIKAGAHAVKQSFELFKTDMRLNTTEPTRHASVLATRCGQSAAEVDDLLNRISFAANFHGKLPNGEAADLLKSIALLRARIDKRTQEEKNKLAAKSKRTTKTTTKNS